MQDEIDSVKVRTIESTLKLAEKLNKKEVGETIVPAISQLASSKKSAWRIRYAAAEVLGPLI